VIVDACVRQGTGGSATAVVDDDETVTDADRQSVAARVGVSHAAFVRWVPRADGSRSVRFFTAGGELTGCGHGTIAAQAVALERSGTDEQRIRQHTGGRTFDTVAVRRPEGIEVWFDQGVVALREPLPEERDAVVAALGLTREDLHPEHEVIVASPGTPRLLVPVRDRRILRRILPGFAGRTEAPPRPGPGVDQSGPREAAPRPGPGVDQSGPREAAPRPGPGVDRLASACRGFGLLGCFVYVPPSPDRPAAARMFAPAIGVAEDVANANSAGCLAAHLLAATGAQAVVEVEQGDALGRPATVFASATAGPDGVETRVGGLAVVRGRDLTASR